MSEKIDKLVAEKVMGENLKPYKDLAMVAIGRKYILATGPVFDLTTGDKLPMPRDLDALRIPEGSTDLNDRYCLYVAEFLGERIADEVDSYRLNAKPYSTNIWNAWLVTEKLRSEGLELEIHGNLNGWNIDIGSVTESDGYVYKAQVLDQDTASMAICLAALKAVGVEVSK